MGTRMAVENPPLLKLINGLIFSDTGSYRFQGEEITEKKLQDPILQENFIKKLDLFSRILIHNYSVPMYLMKLHSV